MRTLAWSFAALFATALAQLALVAVTGSVALLGDTIHNFADALTALPLGIAFLLGRRAATRRYTYGLGRAEDLAGVVVVLIIATSAALAAYESIVRLIDPRPVTHLWVVALAGLIGFAGNELVARYRITVGRRIGSAALVADGLHARTDGFASLAVVLGALGVALGFPAADPIVGLGITVAILCATPLARCSAASWTPSIPRPWISPNAPRRMFPASSAPGNCGCAGSGTACVPNSRSRSTPP